MRCALLLLLAASAAAEGVTSTGLAPSGEPICKDGKWTETTQEALDSGAAVPQVQCWRETPCVQSHYMTFERCAAMKEEDDFPARDPLLFSSPGQRTMVRRGGVARTPHSRARRAVLTRCTRRLPWPGGCWPTRRCCLLATALWARFSTRRAATCCAGGCT